MSHCTSKPPACADSKTHLASVVPIDTLGRSPHSGIEHRTPSSSEDSLPFPHTRYWGLVSQADTHLVLLNEEPPPKPQSRIFGRLAASLAPLRQSVRGLYHYSLLRLVLRESRSACYRILSSR